jgi:hypothetical protein
LLGRAALVQDPREEQHALRIVLQLARAERAKNGSNVR